jgi:hypothetical protein
MTRLLIKLLLNLWEHNRTWDDLGRAGLDFLKRLGFRLQRMV